MQATNNVTLRALRDLALLAGAGVAAASLWAGGLPQEEGYLLEADTWQQEVLPTGQPAWPRDGWYRLVPGDRVLEVRAVKPGDGSAVPANALYLRLPGAALKQGALPAYRYASALVQPQLGEEYELGFGKTRFSLRVDEAVKGMQYTIAYGGQSYRYTLGPADATTTSVRLVADIDGDGLPDFLVQVEGSGYLLLSSRALPGANLPAAELLASPDDDGC